MPNQNLKDGMPSKVDFQVTLEAYVQYVTGLLGRNYLDGVAKTLI